MSYEEKDQNEGLDDIPSPSFIPKNERTIPFSLLLSPPFSPSRPGCGRVVDISLKAKRAPPFFLPFLPLPLLMQDLSELGKTDLPPLSLFPP